MDFQQVVAIDSSAFSQLDGIAASLVKRGVELLFSGLLDDLALQQDAQPHLSKIVVFPDMNAALEHLEEEVLTGPPKRSGPKICSMRHTLSAIEEPMAKSTSDNFRQAAVPSEADCCFFDYVCASLMECMVAPAVAKEEIRSTCVALRGYFQFEEVPAGSVLWSPGDPADFAFFLVTGHVGVLDDHIDCCRQSCGQHKQKFVETSERGQFTGELNLFTGDLRKNTIIATERSSLWTITRKRLEQMQSSDMKLAFLLQGIALRYASQRMYLSMLDGRVHTV